MQEIGRSAMCVFAGCEMSISGGYEGRGFEGAYRAFW